MCCGCVGGALFQYSADPPLSFEPHLRSASFRLSLSTPALGPVGGGPPLGPVGGGAPVPARGPDGGCGDGGEYGLDEVADIGVTPVLGVCVVEGVGTFNSVDDGETNLQPSVSSFFGCETRSLVRVSSR